MSIDALQIVTGTAEAAFGTDETGRIVIWNPMAERLFGSAAEEVLGKPCHAVLGGKDAFGNRFCDENCALYRMIRRHEAIRHFQMEIENESGEMLRLVVSVIVLPGPRPSQFTIIHFLRPFEELAAPHGLDRTASIVPFPLASAEFDAVLTLTVREAEVLHLLVDGRSNEQIADLLFISVTTVRNHVQNILRKLNVHSKLEAVSLALRKRLI